MAGGGGRYPPTLPPIADRSRGGGASSSMALQRGSSPSGGEANPISSNNNSYNRTGGKATEGKPPVLNASYFRKNGLAPIGATAAAADAAQPSHAARNAYGRRLRELVKDNEGRRDAAYASTSAIGGGGGAANGHSQKGVASTRRPSIGGGVGSSAVAGATPQKKRAEQHISDNIVDISVREDAARRRGIGHAIDCKKPKDYTVDWSAFGVAEVPELRQHIPRVGETFRINQGYLQRLSAEKAEVAKAAKQAEDHERLRGIYTFGEATKQAVLRSPDAATNQLTYIKAKDRTYAFVDKASTLDSTDGGGVAVGVGRWLVRNAQGVMEERVLTGAELQAHEEKMNLYRCTVLRLGGNQLTAITATFAADLRQLLFRPALHLSIVDLSSNKITTISPEGFDSLPIHTLYLHYNRIADAQTLYALEGLAPTLRKLSVYGNPIQRKVHPDLRPITLAILPFLAVLDDAPVTMRERADTGAGKAQPAALTKAQQERQRILNAKARAEALAAAQANSSYYYGAGARAGSPSQSPNRSPAQPREGGGASPGAGDSPSQ